MNHKSVEIRRTFNLGDYETVNLSTLIYSDNVCFYEFYLSQITLINQVLELFKCRKIAAQQAFNNKLADFCERQETQLMKEKELLEKKISSSVPLSSSYSHLQNFSPVFTVDNAASAEWLVNQTKTVSNNNDNNNE